MTTPLTFKQFMEATSHLDKVMPPLPEAAEKLLQCVKGEKQILLEGDGLKQWFYTKEDAKEFAQKQYNSPLKWYKKDGVVYTKDAKGNYLYRITL